MARCAYCLTKKALTKEHVFSDWIASQFGLMESTVASAPERRYQSLIKLKDVCADCNSGPLSVLDSYAKSLQMHDPASGPAISADPEKLARYLLKCGYNDARANVKKAQNAGKRTKRFRKRVKEYACFAPFILGSTGEPMDLDVLGGMLAFSRTVGVGQMDVSDSGRRIAFNAFFLLGGHCFLVLGWRAGTGVAYREAILEELCRNHGWTQIDQAGTVTLAPILLAGAILPSGTKIG